jgi:chromosome segregation ATPase
VRENNLLRNKLNEFEDFENSKIENLNKENLEKELLLLKNLRDVKIQNESLSSRITTLE